jgi:hypothetical protein
MIALETLSRTVVARTSDMGAMLPRFGFVVQQMLK